MLQTNLTDKVNDSINFLRVNGLLSREYYFEILPILIYCLPPPKKKSWNELLTALDRNNVVSSWVNQEAISKLRSIFTNGSWMVESSNEIELPGQNYPVWFGIKQIDENGQLSQESKKELIEKFVEIIYEMTICERRLSFKSYYNDVYRLRDVLVADELKIEGVIVKKENLIKNKRYDVSDILAKKRYLGDWYAYSSSDQLSVNRFILSYQDLRFWSSFERPPMEPPVERNPNASEQMRNVHLKAVGNRRSSSKQNEQSEADLLVEEYSTNAVSVFARKSIHSYSGLTQLSLNSILSYLEFCLTKNRKDLAAIAILGFTTSIPLERLKKVVKLKEELSVSDQLKRNNIVAGSYLIKDEVVCRIQYKVNNFAALRLKDKGLARNYVSLNLPAWLFQKLIQLEFDSHKYRNNLEAFRNEVNSIFYSPTHDRICKSSNILSYTKNKTVNHILSGDIPAQLKNRCAYISYDNSSINERFQEKLLLLYKELANAKQHYPNSFQLLQNLTQDEGLKQDKIESFKVGSQISDSVDLRYFKKNPPEIYTLFVDENTSREVIRDKLNEMEEYYALMLSFVYATRQWGGVTSHESYHNFVLHSDKDSKNHIETKVLLPSQLATKQFYEVSFARTRSYSGYHDNLSKAPPLQHQSNKFSRWSDGNLLDRSESHGPFYSRRLGKYFREILPNAENKKITNAFRHAIASHLHHRLGENFADLALGHVIELENFSSPNSTATIDVLKVLNQELEKLAEDFGFLVVQNPIRKL